MQYTFNVRDNPPSVGITIVFIAVWLLLFAQVPATAVAQDALELGEVYIQKNPDVNDRSYNPYQLVVTVANVGDAVSDGFYVGCWYECRPGGGAMGFDVINGGYLRGHSSFKYSSSFRYVCVERPPTITFQCTVRSAAGHENKYNFFLALP